MRTRFDMIKYVSTLRDNWEKMSQLSNNDYDIHYFNSRISVDNEAVEFLKMKGFNVSVFMGDPRDPYPSNDTTISWK